MAVVLLTDESGKTKEYEIKEEEFLIGRESSSDICLDADFVSRKHAIIRKDGERYLVIDNSANGTIVDGVRLQKGDEREIKHGSVIIIGDANLRFVASAEDEEARTMLLPTAQPPRIVLLQDGKPVKEFPLEQDEFSIGSEESSDITLTGTYVSRKHASIVHEGDAYILRDSSVNGTFVNSNRVNEHKLVDGDSISIVDYELQFVTGESAAGAPSAISEKQKKQRIRIAALGASIVLVLLIIVLAVTSPPKKPPPKTADKQPALPVELAVSPALKEADDLVAQERWNEALNKLRTISATNPAYMDAQKRIQTIRGEMRCQEVKPEIERLLAVESFVEAENLLKGFPQGSKCSESMRARFDARRDEFCANNLREAREKLEQEGPQQAKPLLDRVLAVVPEHQEALQLAKVVEERMAEIGKSEEKPGSAKPAPTGPSVEDRNHKIAQTNYDEALQAYREGNIPAAVSRMEKIGSLRLSSGDPIKGQAANALKHLREAKSRYENGKRHYESKEISKAFNEWNAFLAQDRRLDPGRKGKFFRDVADKMTATYCGFGQKKYKEEDYPAAFEWWWKAKQIDPENPAANGGLHTLEKRAIAKYREGYVLAGRGSAAAAAECFRETMQLLPENHEYYRKAQKKLIETGQE